MNYIEEYNNKIVKGEIITSQRVAKQYEKLVHDLYHSKQYIFDIDKANKPIEFIEKFCKHSKGKWSGKPIKLLLFQKAYIHALFGFIDKNTGFRRYRESFFLVARKNGKSVLLSALILYMLIADGEGGAECYSLASKKDQANIIFDETHSMIQQNKTLSNHIRKRKSDLYFGATFSKFQSLAKNSNSLDGLNSHFIVIDEIHAIKDLNIYEVMQQSSSARQQPLLISITTAGTIRDNIFDNLYNYSCNLIDGIFDDNAFLPILYELDDEKEWTDPTAWMKSNPALNEIKSLEDLERKVERAKNDSTTLTGLLTKDFDIRQNSSKSWLQFQDIDNTETFNLEDFKNCYAIFGADLSKSNDLTAGTVLILDPKTNKKYVHQMFWLPNENFIERVEVDKIHYDVWLNKGYLRLCEGNTINYSDVTAWFLEIVNEYEITPIFCYYDNWSATYWRQEMKDHGFNMIPVIQGKKTLSLPMQEMGADLQAKKINYNNNPITKWCLANTEIEEDINGNIQPIKSNSPKMKIDGTASMLNCYVGLMDHYKELKNM